MAPRMTKSASLPAPVGGLNDRDSLADMKPEDAVILINWWPSTSNVVMRKGSADHVTGFAAPVETLAEYYPPNGANAKKFACSGSGIYDVTTAGAVGAAVVSGLANARWESQNVTTPGGSYLYMVNGVNKPRLYDGSAWTAIDGVSTPAITGVTSTLLAHVCLFKNRLFFTETNSLRVWYLPINSVGGAASQLDFGSIFRNGGRVEACYTWTIDAGSGADDHFIVITSNGEVAVYQGSDPSSATTWNLIGVFQLGKPLGRRCAAKYGGDLALNTVSGVYPLGRALLSASVDRSVALTDKIQNSVNTAAQSYGINTGWQVLLHPDANMLLLNIPVGNGGNYQYAQNTITKAWTQFMGWDAYCWLSASNGLFYGSGNAVVKAWTGNLDNSVPIQADILPAFSYFKAEARNKFFTMVRPNVLSNGKPSVTYGLNTDFNPQDITSTLDYYSQPVMTWGSMSWGAMIWGGTFSDISGWNTVGAVGNSASLRMKVQNNGSEVRLSNVDYVYQIGGIL